MSESQHSTPHLDNSKRMGKSMRFVLSGAMAIGAGVVAFGLALWLALEGMVEPALAFLGALLCLSLLASAIFYLLLLRERKITRALFSQLEAVGEHLPRTSFWARRPSGRFEWFLTREKDPERVIRQITAAAPVGVARAVDFSINSSGDSVIPGALEASPPGSFRVESAVVDIGMNEQLMVGMTHQIDSISDNNPVIKGLLPMVSNRFRIHLYSQDLKTVYVYWTPERWKHGLGVPLDPSIVLGYMHPDDIEPAMETMRRCIDERKAATTTFRWIWPEGRDNITMASSLSPMYDNMGNFCGVLTLAYDISADLGETLDQVRNKISVHIYEQFLTRLPQFADPVLKQLEILASRLEVPSDFAELDAFGSLKRTRSQTIGEELGFQADRLRRDLMELSGAISFMADSAMTDDVSHSLAPVSLTSVLQAVLRINAGKLSDREMQSSVTLKANYSTNPTGLLHSENFLSAIRIIVENSIKHSPIGGSLEIRILDDPSDPKGYLVVEIHDDGPGPDGVDYSSISDAYLLASPIQSSVRDDTHMVLATLMLLKQGVFLSYRPKNRTLDPKLSGLSASLRIRRAS